MLHPELSASHRSLRILALWAWQCQHVAPPVGGCRRLLPCTCSGYHTHSLARTVSYFGSLFAIVQGRRLIPPGKHALM